MERWRRPELVATLRLSAAGFGLAAALVALAAILRPAVFDPGEFGTWTPFVAGAGLLAWLAAFVVERRLGRGVPAFTAILGGLAVAAAVIHNAQPVWGALTGTHLRTWNVYHYHIGSKYFPELGYRDLYAATLAADEAWLAAGGDPEAGFAHITHTRDMATYEVVTRRRAVAGFNRSAFSDERFAELGRDTRALRPRLSRSMWEKVFKDWGYNPAPPWTVFGRPLASLIPPDSPALWLIANSDLPLFALMFGCLWWAFGPRTALVALLWVNVIHFNRGRFAGGFWQYDWLAGMVISLALYRRGRGAAAGAVLSFAAMTRAFPGLMAVPVAAFALVELARGRGPLRSRIEPRRIRFLASLALCCALLAGAACLTGRGPRVWPEWIDNIVRHADVLHLDPMHLGAGRLAQHDPASGTPLEGHRQGTRAERLAAGRPIKLAIQLLGGLLLLGALLGRRDEDAMILTLFAAFLAVTMTRYYGTAWVLLLLLGARERAAAIPWPALLSGVALLGMAATFYLPGGNWARYTVANYAALATFCGICLYYWGVNLKRLRGGSGSTA
jgi:hypothetical protein